MPVLLAVMLLASAAGPARVNLVDLQNQIIDPFQAVPSTKAIAFVFLSTDCPISNRYAPEVRRLYDLYAPQGVLFWLVYPNRSDTPDAIREHLKAFSYPQRALRDLDHALVARAHVTVTPEALVYTTNGRLVYRGRIDDRYVRIGLERAAPTRHDLQDALSATLSGKTVSEPVTTAIGCFVADAR